MKDIFARNEEKRRKKDAKKMEKLKKKEEKLKRRLEGQIDSPYKREKLDSVEAQAGEDPSTVYNRYDFYKYVYFID